MSPSNCRAPRDLESDEALRIASLKIRLVFAEMRARRWRLGFWIVWGCWIGSAALKLGGVL